MIRDENGETDIYKVSVLQALRWSEVEWNAISAETIHNCWRHTTLLNSLPCPGAEEEEKSINALLLNGIGRLHIRTPLSIKELIEPAVEQTRYEEYDDEDFLGMGQDEREEDNETFLPAVAPKDLLNALQLVLRDCGTKFGYGRRDIQGSAQASKESP